MEEETLSNLHPSESLELNFGSWTRLIHFGRLLVLLFPKPEMALTKMYTISNTIFWHGFYVPIKNIVQFSYSPSVSTAF